MTQKKHAFFDDVLSEKHDPGGQFSAGKTCFRDDPGTIQGSSRHDFKVNLGDFNVMFGDFSGNCSGLKIDPG